MFTNILVADEINRASPKTQAALLEVMEERQVHRGRREPPRPRPFMVVATQNPMDFDGTYPLPEVRLDRFAMKINIGYADEATEIEIMGRPPGIDPVSSSSRWSTPIRSASWCGASAPSPCPPRCATTWPGSSPAPVTIPTSDWGQHRGTLTLLSIAKSYAVGDGPLLRHPGRHQESARTRPLPPPRGHA